MYFSQLKKIVKIERGQSIQGEVYLTGDEQYLLDHFPNFACMPGVLMLESMFQCSAWLLRHEDDFSRPYVKLSEARNIKYGNFLTPGSTLEVEVKKVKEVEEGTFRMKGQGSINGEMAVSGVLIVEQFCLTDRVPIRSRMDAIARKHYIKTFKEIYAEA